MKALLTALILTLAIAATAQTDNEKAARYFVNEVIDKTQATIVRDTIISKSRYTTTILPEYYDFDLAKMQVRSVRGKYSDVDLIENWTRRPNGNNILILAVGNVDILIIYSENYLQYSYDWTIK